MSQADHLARALLHVRNRAAARAVVAPHPAVAGAVRELNESRPMPAPDTSLSCRDCAQPFTFTAEEQEAFASQGHAHAPSRCASCRAERKARQEETGGLRPLPRFRDRGEQQSTSTTCGACGKSTVVPFAMARNRVAFCSPCYEERRAGLQSRRR